MKQEKIGAATPIESGDPCLLGSSRDYVAQNGKNLNLKAALNATSGSGVRILRDRDFGRLLGNPQVIIEPRNGCVFVSVRPRPWGWQNVDKEFFGAGGADRYGQALLARIREEGRKEHQRRERQKLLRQRERARP